MRVTISGEVDGSIGLGAVVTDLCGPTRKYFQEKQYGGGIERFVIVLVCHERSSSLKRRIRFTKKDKLLGFDIMLDYEEMKRLSHPERMRKVIATIMIETPQILKKYSIPCFDNKCFVEDFTNWLNTLLQ